MTLSERLGLVLHVLTILSGAVACGFVAWKISFPLPWMVGALVFAGSVRLLNFRIRVPAQTRKLGQVLVASSVGLAFTPEALRVTGTLAVPMVVTALLTILLSFLVARALVRRTGADPSTAILSILPIGPVESAVLARRYQVAPGPVIFSQTIRIVTIVILIPPVIVFLDGRVEDPVAILSAADWSFGGAALLFVLGLAGGQVMAWIRAPNPYFLGALLGASLAALFSLPVSAYPYVVIAGAQIFLGIWLGAAIDRDLFRNASTLLPGLFLSSITMILLCIVLGLGLALTTGQPWQVMILSAAPGSVTEMALTAKILQEGLAVVTAFHILRIFIIIPFSGLIVAQSVRFLRVR